MGGPAGLTGAPAEGNVAGGAPDSGTAGLASAPGGAPGRAKGGGAPAIPWEGAEGAKGGG